MKLEKSINRIAVTLCLISTITLPCLAINETQTNTEIKETPKFKFFHKFSKNSKKTQDIKQDSNITEPNKNLITPNESPGIIMDPNKIKRYYDYVDEAHRKDKNITDKEEVIEKTPLQLPPRLNENETEVRINKLEFTTKSEIFSDDELNEFKSLVENKDVTAEDIDNLVLLVNKQYKKKGAITARAFLTVQNLQGGVLKIELMEAKINKVYVEGNKFNRKWFLKRMIEKREGQVLDIESLEKDLLTFNKNARSVKLSARLKPGEEYGTTDIILDAHEEFPFHFSVSYDSFGRDTTGLLRTGFMASADSLFGFQDRLTGAVNLARSSVSPYVDYNIPINRHGTRIGASYMYGGNKTSRGAYKDFDLEAQTNIFSGYITHPIKDTQNFSLNLNTSANFKLSSASIYDFTYSDFKDYNLAIGLGGRRNFKNSILFASLYSTNGIIENTMEKDTGLFTKITADGYYLHYLPKGIIATLRAGGQYTPSDISYVEQYQIGGISSVRGYTESLLLAPNSYFASLEMLFPIPFLPQKIKIPFQKEKTFNMKEAVKFAVFFDQGAVFERHQKVRNSNFLASVGAGLRIALSKFLTARIYIGVPLMNKNTYDQAGARLHFDLIASPF